MIVEITFLNSAGRSSAYMSANFLNMAHACRYARSILEEPGYRELASAEIAESRSRKVFHLTKHPFEEGAVLGRITC